MSDQFEYGNLSDAECIPLADEIIRQTRTETDSVILEMIWNAVHVLITNRNVADQLDLLPLKENWHRFDAQSAEYLPDIFAAAGIPQYREIIRQICSEYPQIDLPSDCI